MEIGYGWLDADTVVVVCVWYGSDTGEVMDGEMLILTFEIAKGTESGTYPISISWDDNAIFDSNSDMVAPVVTQGAIVIN